MKFFKRSIIFAVVLSMLLCTFLPSCAKNGEDENVSDDVTTPESTTESAKDDKNPVIADTVSWVGDCTEEKMMEAIAEYQEKYTPITVTEVDMDREIYVNIGKDAVSCSVPRISCVGDRPDQEWGSAIYLALEHEYDSESGNLTANFFWWYNSDGASQDHPIWSYVVCAKNEAGSTICYYFRINYTK